MLNGDKMKLRKIPTISTSFTRNTKKLSSCLGGLAAGAGAGAAGVASGWGSGVWSIGAVMLGKRLSVKREARGWAVS